MVIKSSIFLIDSATASEFDSNEGTRNMEHVWTSLFRGILISIIPAIFSHYLSRPRYSKIHPNRVHQPMFIGVIIWLAIICTVLRIFVLLSESSEDDQTLHVFLYFAVLCVGIFAFCLYQRWYLEINPDWITIRTGLRAPTTILYVNIVTIDRSVSFGHEITTIRDYRGAIIQVNSARYDLSKLYFWVQEQGGLLQDLSEFEISFINRTLKVVVDPLHSLREFRRQVKRDPTEAEIKCFERKSKWPTIRKFRQKFKRDPTDIEVRHFLYTNEWVENPRVWHPSD